MLLGPSVPMLFQGEEWAASTPFLYFTDHEDPELGRLVSEGRRREFAAFGWAPEDVPDPQSPKTFEQSKLDWDEVGEGVHRELLDWHRRLIALRRSEPALSSGSFDDLEVRFDEDERWLVVDRGPITIACNFAPEPRSIPGLYGTVVLASDAADGTGPVPPESVRILRRPHP